MSGVGSIVGAGLLSHAPVIMFAESMRIDANGGKDFTLATGLHRLNRDVFQSSDYDAVIVLDSHWTTTTEFVVTAQNRRQGTFTSAEMPSVLRQIPFDLAGDPELAHAISDQANRMGTWATAIDDQYLPLQYATLNLWSYLKADDKPWLSISVCQTASVDDCLTFGRSISVAVEQIGRRVLLIASGGLSHSFHPLSQLRGHMSGDVNNIISEKARFADERRIAWMVEGEHARVIETMPEFLTVSPEADFGHYLTMIGALGGERCTLKAEKFSDYESGIGTGHVHLWIQP